MNYLAIDSVVRWFKRLFSGVFWSTTDKVVWREPPKPPSPPPSSWLLTPQWRVNFTDRLIEVDIALGGGQTVFLRFTVEQARQFATNLKAMAASLEQAYPPEESK